MFSNTLNQLEHTTLFASALVFDFRIPFRSDGADGQDPAGATSMGSAEIGEALLRPGERAGAVRRLPRPQLHRSWVSSKNPTGGVDPARVARRARRQGRVDQPSGC